MNDRDIIRVALITANLNGIDRDSFIVPDQSISGKTLLLDSFCFNNSNFPPRLNALHPRLNAKIPKMLGCEYIDNYDYYIWVDGQIEITSQYFVAFLLEALSDNVIGLFRHPDRSTILQELNFMTDLMSKSDAYLVSRYNNEPMADQVKLYLSDPDFVDDSLYALGVFIYSSSLIKSGFLKDWFYHNCRYSVQDQLSMPYLLKKFNIVPSVIEQSIYHNDYFRVFGHK